MDLLAMRTRLRERVGNPDTTDIPDATLDLRINEALVDIMDEYNFHAAKTIDESIDTVADQRDYDLPEGIDVIIGVRDNTNGRKLRKMDRGQYDELVAAADAESAQPTRFFRDATKIYLDPPPDDIYNLRLRYRQATVELADDTDEPVIPTSWHIGIVLLARYKYWEVLQDVAKMMVADQAWQKWVSNKSDEIAEELKADNDAAIRVPSLENFASRGLDFDHAD